MRVTCKHCGQQINAEDINLNRLVAKCWSCHAVFDISDQLDPLPESGAREPASSPRQNGGVPATPSVPLPKGITVERGDDQSMSGAYRTSAKQPLDLRITYKWFSQKHIGLIAFSVIWFGFLAFWYITAAGGGAPLSFFTFPLIHVAVGLGLGYSGIAGLFNSTEITVDDATLRITHGPLPWPGNREMLVADLEQLYSEEKRHQQKNGVRYSYTLSAVLKSNRAVNLIKGLEEPAQARYLEQIIEEALGIENRPVTGELPK